MVRFYFLNEFFRLIDCRCVRSYLGYLSKLHDFELSWFVWFCIDLNSATLIFAVGMVWLVLLWFVRFCTVLIYTALDRVNFICVVQLFWFGFPWLVRYSLDFSHLHLYFLDLCSFDLCGGIALIIVARFCTILICTDLWCLNFYGFILLWFLRLYCLDYCCFDLYGFVLPSFVLPSFTLGFFYLSITIGLHTAICYLILLIHNYMVLCKFYLFNYNQLFAYFYLASSIPILLQMVNI